MASVQRPEPVLDQTLYRTNRTELDTHHRGRSAAAEHEGHQVQLRPQRPVAGGGGREAGVLEDVDQGRAGGQAGRQLQRPGAGDSLAWPRPSRLSRTSASCCSRLVSASWRRQASRSADGGGGSSASRASRAVRLSHCRSATAASPPVAAALRSRSRRRWPARMDPFQAATAA